VSPLLTTHVDMGQQVTDGGQMSADVNHDVSLGAVVEQAKGALMLRYGIDSHQAFALLHWCQESGYELRTVARTLVHGICEGDAAAESREPALARWLEERLRSGLPGHAAWQERRATYGSARVGATGAVTTPAAGGTTE